MKGLGDRAEISNPAAYHFPNPVYPWKISAFMGDYNGNPVVRSLDDVTDFLFLVAIEGAERFIEDEEIVRAAKGTGEFKTF